MKYTILGFQQQRLVENELSVEDALLLRIIKDMYSSDRMDSIIHDEKRYIWVNQIYLLEQIPILGSMSKLKRMLNKLNKEGFLERILVTNKKGAAGRFYYVKYTGKLNDLEDYDFGTKCQNDTRPNVKMTLNQVSKCYNKDSSIKDSSIKDSKDIFSYYLSKNLVKHKTLTKSMEKAIAKAKRAGYSIEELKTMLDRHAEVVELTKRSEYPVRKRTLAEFFGQKVKDGAILICEEYSDEGAKYLRYLSDSSYKPEIKEEQKSIYKTLPDNPYE